MTNTPAAARHDKRATSVGAIPLSNAPGHVIAFIDLIGNRPHRVAPVTARVALALGAGFQGSQTAKRDR